MASNLASHRRAILKKIPKELTILKIQIVINSFSNGFDRAGFGVCVCVVHLGKIMPAGSNSNTFFSPRIRYKDDLWMKTAHLQAR